jgi:hypothetical protein
MAADVEARVGVGASKGENPRPAPIPERAPLGSADAGSAVLTTEVSCATWLCRRARLASVAATRAARALYAESSLLMKGGADAALAADTAETADVAGDVAKAVAAPPAGVGVDTSPRSGLGVASLLLAMMVAKQARTVGDGRSGVLVEAVSAMRARGGGPWLNATRGVARAFGGPCGACAVEKNGEVVGAKGGSIVAVLWECEGKEERRRGGDGDGGWGGWRRREEGVYKAKATGGVWRWRWRWRIGVSFRRLVPGV